MRARGETERTGPLRISQLFPPKRRGKENLRVASENLFMPPEIFRVGGMRGNCRAVNVSGVEHRCCSRRTGLARLGTPSTQIDAPGQLTYSRSCVFR